EARAAARDEGLPCQLQARAELEFLLDTKKHVPFYTRIVYCRRGGRPVWGWGTGKRSGFSRRYWLVWGPGTKYRNSRREWAPLIATRTTELYAARCDNGTPQCIALPMRTVPPRVGFLSHWIVTLLGGRQTWHRAAVRGRRCHRA
ncbi:unnamed protein product, partial [Prorocentrum cordatum]